jgi:hypothetical protein
MVDVFIDDGKTDGGARVEHYELTHVGTFRSHTGDVWRSEPKNEQHEPYVDDSYYERRDPYDDNHNDGYDDDVDDDDDDGERPLEVQGQR